VLAVAVVAVSLGRTGVAAITGVDRVGDGSDPVQEGDETGAVQPASASSAATSTVRETTPHHAGLDNVGGTISSILGEFSATRSLD